MRQPKKHRVTFGNQYKGNYVQFSDVNAFHDFVKLQESKLHSRNAEVLSQQRWQAQARIRQNTTWYGMPIPTSTKDLEMHTQFLAMEKLALLKVKIKRDLHSTIKLLQSQVVAKPKLQSNDRGLGVFSFERAAMGLYRIQPTIAHPPLQGLLTQLRIATDTGNKATSIRSTFLHFENQTNSPPSLDLYVLAGGNAHLEGDELLWVGLACGVLTEFMQERHIPVQVHVLLGTYFEKEFYGASIRIKSFTQTLDVNQLLLLSSDPRYFRYRGFQALITLTDYLEAQIPKNLGQIKEGIGKQFIAAIKPKAILFENSYTLDSAVKEVTSIITNYSKQLV